MALGMFSNPLQPAVPQEVVNDKFTSSTKCSSLIFLFDGVKS